MNYFQCFVLSLNNRTFGMKLGWGGGTGNEEHGMREQGMGRRASRPSSFKVIPIPPYDPKTIYIVKHITFH